MEYYAVNTSTPTLQHHGVLGMKWGVRKARPTGSITKNGKYRASNGVVVGRSKNVGAAIGRRVGTSVPGRLMAYAGTGQMAKLTGRSKQSIRDQAKREHVALKEYYRAGGDKMLDRVNGTKKQKQQGLSDRQKKAIKVGVAVAGTALAAYGTYKLASFAQNKRTMAASLKAQNYINDNFLKKYGQSNFKNGRIESYYATKNSPVYNQMTINGRGSKGIGKHNARVVSKARDIYKNSTNTRLDKGLSKIVDAGRNVGYHTRKAGYAVENTTRKAGNAVKSTTNRVLDVINPQYEYVPGKTTTTRETLNGLNITKQMTELNKRKRRRI